MKPLSVDSRILSLASQATESPDQDVPVLLLKLKDILNSAPLGSKELKKIKQDLYYYDLVQYCTLVLKQDYTRVLGGWTTAAQIAEILSQCCVGLEVKEEPEEFYNKLLPSVADNLLFLGRRLQARFIRAIKDEERNEFLHCFRTVTDAICWLCGGFIRLTANVLQNRHFQQLLMTDNVETSTIMMSVLQNILRVNSAVLLQVAEKSLHCILDELVYKLSSSINPVIGNAAIKLLLLIAQSDAQLVTTFATRYKGLQSLLSKQWTGKGFDRNLNQLLDLLCSENYKAVKTQRLHQAACLIQAAWRGFQTRKRLKQLPKAVTILQRNFRAKRKQELQGLNKQKEEEDLHQQLQLRRQRAMRLFHERQLTLLEIVHAGQVDKHMHEMEEKSAITIQKYWRAFRERRNFHHQKKSLKQYKAAVLIQRAVLKFLEKQRKRKAYSLLKQSKQLSDEQRLSLQQKVNDYIKKHPASEMSQEMSRELHHQAQEKLTQYLLKRSQDRKAEQHREALLAQVHTDVDQLMSAPSLTESTTKDLNVFMSRSAPVVAKAKQSHSTMLKYTRWPWWKKLEEDFLEEEAVSEDLSAEVGTLFIGGSKT
ncbi:IQ calmodulin-binding motif-containing protein 1 isoform X2 [Zootoca vivipara]|nr:IQ calmodulin-binding motif-containing protein 1 isoform X2 [Zootoca vivipara]XP_034984758.2 IQ calmodulin-binding motif-containing protein 1 isoform X2 [Zootoca vivipara]XP_034984765.2 IQ calmodulin-binding motif-containing protein 1 isoform X2 [Zootoca vivipara]XP_060134683.1 IQ calmodulin-binding motif-containing protein 1 isoform X2 [Zootoca vivipara]XP_060134691.1 IQ calmodulin-binding motif-containing protein 1 isoform X2 [Zootoca vivipara]